MRGFWEKETKTSYRFYSLMKQQEKEEISAFLFALGIRQDLEDLKAQNAFMEEENVRLTKKAEYDELTGLPNRYNLSDFSDAAFERAYNARRPLHLRWWMWITLNNIMIFTDTKREMSA